MRRQAGSKHWVTLKAQAWERSWYCGVAIVKEKELGCGERFLRVGVTLAEVEPSQSGSGGISARVSQTALL